MEGEYAVEKYKVRGRDLMARRGNVTKILLAFLFCVLLSVIVMMSFDAVGFYFVPGRFEDAMWMLTLAASMTVYSMADVMLLRYGVRTQTGADGKKGSGLSAVVAAGIGFLTEVMLLAFLYAYVEVFSRYVSRVLGLAVNGLCTLLTVFLVGIAVFYIGTGLFFLPAVAEKEKSGVLKLLFASQRAAKGKRMTIVRFVLGFVPLFALSLLSLGVLFFIYVLPLYIMSYGAFASEVLDNNKEI